MSSVRKIKAKATRKPRLRSLRFRLTAHQLLIYSLVSILAFTVFDQAIRSFIMDRIDQELETQILFVAGEFGDPSETEVQSLNDHLRQYGYASGITESLFRVIDGKGELIAASDLTFWPGLSNTPIPLEHIRDRPFFWETIRRAGTGGEDVRVIYYQGPNQQVFQFGRNLKPVQTAIRGMRLWFGGSLILVLLLGSAATWITIVSSLKGIRDVTAAAVAIREAGNLALRVPGATGITEPDELARTFNAMLQRLEVLLDNVRYMTDTIAHDVRSPVARMRAHAESVLLREDTEEQAREVSSAVLEQCDVILSLVNTLLEITSAESGLTRWQMEVVDLATEMKEVIDLFQPIGDVEELSFESSIEEPARIYSDQRAIQRVLSNLIDNAVKYTPTGGKLIFRVIAGSDEVQVDVADSGPGIATDEHEEVFQRFYRSDHSRSLPGNGLGLSYCKATVEALGGRIWLESELNRGAVFHVAFPRFTDHEE